MRDDAAEEGDQRVRLQAGEVWNGRVAMLAVVAYVAQEALTRAPVRVKLFMNTQFWLCWFCKCCFVC